MVTGLRFQSIAGRTPARPRAHRWRRRGVSDGEGGSAATARGVTGEGGQTPRGVGPLWSRGVRPLVAICRGNAPARARSESDPSAAAVLGRRGRRRAIRRRPHSRLTRQRVDDPAERPPGSRADLAVRLELVAALEGAHRAAGRLPVHAVDAELRVVVGYSRPSALVQRLHDSHGRAPASPRGAVRGSTRRGGRAARPPTAGRGRSGAPASGRGVLVAAPAVVAPPVLVGHGMSAVGEAHGARAVDAPGDLHPATRAR
jgi:hypothetical protein